MESSLGRLVNIWYILVLSPLWQLDSTGAQSTVTVLFSTSLVSVTEGSTVGIQLTAQGTYDLGFTVNLTFHDGSARLLRDYLYPGYPAVTPSVTFSPGSLSSSVFTVIAIGNNAFDPGQRRFTVRYELPNVPGLRLRRGRPDRLSVSITDDDFVAVSFTSPSQKVHEGFGSIPVRLKSRGFYSSPFQMSFTCVEVAPVEAENGADFISKVHTVTFDTTGTEETMSTVESIPILDDKVSESTVESFICVILRPHGLEGIVVEDPNTITFAICDDDNLTVRFEQDSYTGEEGTPVTNIRLLATDFADPFRVQIFVFTLDADVPEKEVEADINADLRDPQALLGSGVVSFDRARGLVSTPLTIPLFSDNIAEGTEYFGLTFAAVTDEDNPIEIIPVEPTQVLVAIEDTNEIFVKLNNSKIQVVEDERSADVYFEIVREESPGVYVPAEYTFDFDLTVTTVGGTATADTDFVDKTDTVTFSAGERYSSPFTVTINEDTVSEDAEEFTVRYSIAGSSVRNGATVSQLDTTATVVIIDRIFLQFEREEYVIDEDEGNIEVRLVVLNGTVYQPFSVTVELVDGTALDLQDAVLIDTFATFQVNDNISSVVNLAIFEDFILERDEKFTVRGEAVFFVKILPPNPKVTIKDSDILSVNLTSSVMTVTEGTDSEVMLTVISDIVAAFPFHVYLNPVNRTAENGSDFTATDPIRVDFAAFEQNVSVSFPLINDSVAEPMERFRVELEVPSEFTTRNITMGGNVRTTVNINDDDCVTVTITTDEVDTTTEGRNLPLTVTVDGDFSEPFEVVIAMTGGTATGGTDFDNQNLSVHFETSGVKSQKRVVDILHDDLNEGDEWFLVTLSRVSSTSMCYKIENGTLNMTIEDDDGITIHFQQGEYSVEEGTDLSVHLNISGHIQYPFTVEVLPCSQLNGPKPSTKIPDGASNATIDDDFSRAPIPVTFQLGMLVSAITVFDIVNDDLLEGSELFELCFQLDEEEENRKITPGDPESAVVTITDDPPDAVCVLLSTDAYSANEDSGSITVTIETDKQSFSIPFDVVLSIFDPFVTNDRDIPTLEYTVNIPAGASSVTQAIAVNPDFVLEDDETFLVTLQPTQAAMEVRVSTCPQSGKANITIVNDDILSVNLAIPDLTVTEGANSEVMLTVITDIVAAFPFHVYLNPVDSTAENGNDFTAANPIRLDFAAFEQNVSVSFPLINDNVAEPMEGFRVELEVPSEFTTRSITVGGNVRTTVNINDDDCVTVTIATNRVGTTEGTNLPLKVTVDGNFSEPFDVVITMSDGTATGGADFDNVDWNIHFEPSGAKVQEREVEILGDDLNEGDEWFIVTLSRVSSTSMCYKIGNELSMTIEDDDGIAIYFQQGEYSVEEGSDISVHLNISGHIQYPFTVEVLPCSQLNGPIPDTKIPDVANKATIDDDFSRTPTPYSVTFQPGMLVSTIAVIDIIVNDELLEGPELFELCFQLDQEVENRKITPGDPESAVVTITDDPPDAVCVSLSMDAYSSDEDNGSITVTIETAKQSFVIQFDVVLSISDPFMTNDRDIPSLEYTVSIPAGAFSVTQVIVVKPDFVLEDDETFLVALQPTQAAMEVRVSTCPQSGKADITIVNDDILSVNLTIPDLTVTEGANSEVMLTVITDIVSAFPFHVYLNPVDRTAENGNDFTAANPIRVDFAAFEQNVSVSFPLINDNVAEPMERFRLELEVPSEFTTRNITVEGNERTTVNINDDDCVTVTLVTNRVGTTEGTNLPLKVTVDGNFSEPFDVVITMSDGTATGGTDFDNVDLNIHFEPSGAKVQEREVEILEDDLNEGDEWFIVTLSRVSSTSMCYKIENGTLNMTIGDDDGITIHFQQGEYSVEEGTDLSVHLNISGHIQYPFTVEVLPCSQLNGPIPDTKIPDGVNKATIDDDFSRIPVPVTFQPGMLVSTIAVIDIVNDDLLEGPELFELCFQLDEEEENRKITPGDPESAVVTITDDPPNSTIVVGFLKRRVTNSEGHLVSFNVSRSGNMDREMYLNVFSQTSFSNAKEGPRADYELLTQELVFSRVDALYEEQSVTVRLLKDDLPELKEHFFLSLETLEGVVYHNQHVAVFIEDVDHKRSCVIEKTDTIPYIDLICT